MESNMVTNRYNEIVKSFFKVHFPSYIVVAETVHGPYWGIRLKEKYTEINISGDIGFSIEILIDGSKFDLWQYDRRVNDAMKTTEQNIIYQLEILRDFLNEKPN